MSDDEMNRLVYEAQQLRGQGQQLQAQLESIEDSISEALSTIDALKEFKKSPEMSMVPVGSGVYMKGGKIKASTVLIGVGANVIVERPLDQAVATLEKRIEASRKLSEQIQKALGDINSKLEEIDNRAKKMIEEEGA
ncbi:MAG: prefoldin subunit alpha [Candidatus Micrarchaeia archaeon]